MMSLLHEIQASLLSNNSELGPTLLKLRFLASRLGNNPLEEWVKHESEGYPNEIDVPRYRRIGVSYVGTFSGPFGSGIRNAPIPPYLIEKYAGESWTNYEIRQSIAGIDELISKNHKSNGTLTINSANLILLMQGKIYEGYACNSITGTLSVASLAEIKHAVKNRILELTLEIEKSLPEAGEITLGAQRPHITNADKDRMMNITNHIVYGDNISISNSGDGSKFNTNVLAGDNNSLVEQIERSGISKDDAKDFIELLAAEKPESTAEPFGANAKKWISKNIGKALDGTWKAGLATATSVLTEAAKQYYGLK